MFQPSDEAGWNLANDFSLWRAIAREVSEELLGTSEDYGSDRAPIDYGALAVLRRAHGRAAGRDAARVLARGGAWTCSRWTSTC